MHRVIITIVLAAALPLSAAPRRRSSSAPAQTPRCSAVTGTPAVAFTHDEGRFVTRPNTPLTGIGYTYGVATLDTPYTLLSWHRNTLSISNDDGCSWSALGDFAYDFPPSITAAKGGRAYAWSDNRALLLRYDARGAVMLKAPGVILGLGTDPNDGTRLRVGTDDGAILESKDSGDTWTRIASLKASTPLFYRFAFDPMNLDHIVAGVVSDGAYVSFDAGVTWLNSTSTKRMNVFNLVVSPADSNFVWAMGVELDTSIKRILLSKDGGITYRGVVANTPGITLVNGPVMAAHPKDANVLYFVFGSSFQNYGTDLFRYDAALDVLSVAHNDFDDIDAIAFGRDDPGLMYLGLETQRGVF